MQPTAQSKEFYKLVNFLTFALKLLFECFGCDLNVPSQGDASELTRFTYGVEVAPAALEVKNETFLALVAVRFTCSSIEDTVIAAEIARLASLSSLEGIDLNTAPNLETIIVCVNMLKECSTRTISEAVGEIITFNVSVSLHAVNCLI